MSVLNEPQDVYIIWGEAPDVDWAEGAADDEPKFGEQVTRPVEVEFAPAAADAYVLRGVHAAFTSFLGALKPGGTMSVMVYRGGESVGEDETRTTGSFVINNPDGGRHVWEYRVQKRQAVVSAARID